MVKKFIIGTKYYLKVDTTQMELDIVNNPNEMLSLTFDGGAQARFDNGSWISQGSYNYILLRVTGNPNQQAIYVGGSWYNLSDYNTFEIIGNLRSTQQALTTSNNYKLMLRSAIDNPVEFHLYNVNGKFNDAQKLLNNDKDYFGVFKEETDILNPTILIETDTFITSNYAYIQSYNRYYFITDITCVRKNLYRLSLKVDVLKTWYRDIRYSSEGLIVRSGNSEIYGGGELVDDRLPLKDYSTIDVREIPRDDSRVNVTFITEPDYGSTFNIAVTCMNDTSTAFADGVDDRNPPSGTNLPKVGKRMINNPTLITYFLSPFEYVNLAQFIKNRSNLSDYIVNITFYPFNIAPIDGARDSDNNLLKTRLRVNNTDITRIDNQQPIDCYYTRSNVSSYLVTACKLVNQTLLPNLHFEDGLSFLNREPYSTYQIYIPFNGWEDVKNYEILGKTIMIYYVTDYSSGLSRWYLYNETQEYAIKSGTCELGFRIGINTTNMYELNRQKQANASSTALGVLGSLIGMGVSIGTGNVVGGVGSGLSLAQSIASGINRNNLLIEHGNVSTGGDAFGNYNAINPYIKHTFHEIVDGITYSYYVSENGLPVNKFTSLDEYNDNEMKGYIEITSFHMSASLLSITKTEMDEIESLLKTGVFL